jgi:hypothetical protein
LKKRGIQQMQGKMVMTVFSTFSKGNNGVTKYNNISLLLVKVTVGFVNANINFVCGYLV